MGRNKIQQYDVKLLKHWLAYFLCLSDDVGWCEFDALFSNFDLRLIFADDDDNEELSFLLFREHVPSEVQYFQQIFLADENAKLRLKNSYLFL